MTRSAQVENMVVVNVIVGTVPGSIPCPEWVSPGDTYDGTEFHAAPQPPATEDEKRDSLQQYAWLKMVALSENEARAAIDATIFAHISRRRHDLDLLSLLSPDEQQFWNQRATPWLNACKAIYTAMDTLLDMDPIPDDWRDASYWP